MRLSDHITNIKGIGPRRAEAFGKLGLISLRDLLYYAPRSYRDFSSVCAVKEAAHGTVGAFHVVILSEAKLARIHRAMQITTVRVIEFGADPNDKKAQFTLVWYNQPYRGRSLTPGEAYYACGRLDRSRGTKLVNPSLSAELPGIEPVYPLVAGLSQKVVRDAVSAALTAVGDAVEETLPAAIVQRYGLLPLSAALRELHRPTDMAALSKAKDRLAFEDMLLYSLMVQLLRDERLSFPGRPMRMEGVLDRFLKTLPFVPTGAQRRAMEEISREISAGRRMNRLLQGDVGSGKTAVALFLMFAAAQNGAQSVLMAPTEILARQHYRAVENLFPGKTVLLVGGMKKKEHDAALAALKSGEAVAAVGTHALLSEGVEFHDLGAVIADEQHRFGVRQRAAIGAKGENAHMLIMSATPIPRTLSLILYGDLEVSLLDELPPGRKPIMTRYVPRSKREAMYNFLQQQIDSGRQAYVVCPLVEQSEALEGVLSASDLFRELENKLHAKLALLHGRMAAAKKDETAEAFRRGEIDVLVSTTVIEVGVDVRNASVMVIENADRFGLAQLHQLRGRVGRGSEEAYCFLLSESDADSARERLSALAETNDGFVIAEKDLSMRGPGEFLGERQHGVNELTALRLACSMELLKDSRSAAQMLLAQKPKEALPLIEKAKQLLSERGGIAPN
ncbi:MAG: ATP-dependent DNA helicase RecG [Clostridia bacterium]|nr:ATP-dependent DNA helicase RecG [Clostridia bacterium]